MTQTDLTAADEPQAPPVTQGPQGPEAPPVTQGPEVPWLDRNIAGRQRNLLEKAKTGDPEARERLRKRLMDPLTDPGTKRDISAALEAGAEEEAEAIKKQPVPAYRPAWFGWPEAQVSLGRLRNAETLGRTRMDPQYLERLESGAAGVVEQYAETFILPPARAISIALGIPDVDVEKRTKELGSDIEFLEQTIIPKAVDALKAGHNTQEIINGLKAQGIEADREFGKSVDAAFQAEGIDTKGGYTRLFSSPGELFIQRVKELPPEEASWERAKSQFAKAVPLVGTLLESADQDRIEEAINRVAEGKGTEEDNMLLEAMLIDQYRARSTGYKAVEGIIDMAGFGADLYAGGKIAQGAGIILGRLGRAAGLLPAAAQAAGSVNKFQKALANLAAWSNRTPTSLLQRATRSATRATMEAGRIARQTTAQVAGEAAGSAALTGIAGPEAVFGRAELETKRQQIFQAISGGIDPQSGKFFMAADTVPQDAPEVALPNAVGLLVDVAVEKLGRFVNVPGIKQTPAARRRMLDSLARAVDPAKADRLSYAISQGAKALEINGIVGEILEEYASRTGMAAIGEITGDPEYGRLGDIIPAGEAIADEFIAIASGAGLLQGAGAASAAIGAAGQTQRDRERLTRRIEYMRDVEAAATDPAAAERVRQTNEATRRATGEEIDAALSRVGGTRAEQPEGLEAEQAAQRAADLGIELVFFEGPAEQSGFYDPSSPSTIYINTKAEDPGGALEIETTVHEIAHDMEAVVGEEAFGALKGKLRDADPERWDEAKEDARDELGEIFGEGVLRPIGAEAESEAAASRAEDNGVLVDLLLRSQNARADVQRILQTDQNLFQKVRDGVRNLLSIIPGVKTAKAKGLENLRGALEKRGLEGAELERALEDAELTTADEVSAAMIDVAEMRQLARLRQTRAYVEGGAVPADALYGTEEDFERSLDRDQQLRQAFYDGALIAKAEEELAQRRDAGETDLPTAEQMLAEQREELEAKYGEEADARAEEQIKDINSRPAQERERFIDELLGVTPIAEEAAATEAAPEIAAETVRQEAGSLAQELEGDTADVVAEAGSVQDLLRIASELEEESADTRVTEEARAVAGRNAQRVRESLSRLGVEVVEAEAGVEFRGSEFFKDKPQTIETDDPNLDWTIAEAEPAYMWREGGELRVVPGKAVVYRYSGSQPRTQEAPRHSREAELRGSQISQQIAALEARLAEIRAKGEGAPLGERARIKQIEDSIAVKQRQIEELRQGRPAAEAEVAAEPAAPAAPTRTLAQVEAEIAEIQRMGKKSTLGDRRRKKLLQEEAEALRAQEAAGLIPVGEPGALPLSPMAQAAAERARGEMEAERAAAALPVMPQAARAEVEQPTAEPFLPGARVRINEDAAAFDDIIRQAQDIRGLEVVDATGPAGAQRVEVKVPGEMGTLIVPASDLTLAQPAPGQPSVGGLPYAAMPTIGEREAQERTREDIEQGRTRFARRRRRRRKPPEVLDRFDVEPPTWRERQRIRWFDRLSRLERFEKDAFKQGLRLSEAESPTMAARLMPGKTTYKQEQLELNYVNPILNVLAKAGISLPDFEDFLILRTTEESNEDLRRKRAKAENNRVVARQLEAKWKNTRIDPELPEEVKKEKRRERTNDRKEAKRLRKEADFIDPGKDPKSYYTDEEAQAKLAEIDKNPELKKQLEEAGRLVDEMNKATRKQLLDSGLISQEQHDLWEEKFKHYVPFRTDEGNSSWAEMNTAGYSVSGPEARIRRGTTRKPNPLLFSVQQAGRAIVRGEKNQVGVRAYNFFQKANMLADVEAVEPGQDPDISKLPSFRLKLNGEEKIVTLKDEYLAKALKKFGPGKVGDPTLLDQFIERAAKLTRFMADANTQYNPDFLLVNPIRDQIEAQLKVGELRERGFQLSRAGLLDDSRRAFLALKSGPEVTDQIMGGYYRRFGEAGGLIRLGDMQDYQESVAALEKKLDRMAAASSTNPVGKVFNGLLDLISRHNRAAELAVRLGVFKQLVDNGATDAQAAAVARDITVDFNRRGQDTAAINSLYMFFNASMQGTDRNFRALKTKAGRRTAAALFAAGYMHSYVQAMMSDEDEDGRLEWDNEKWYNKARNIAVGIGAGKILKVPMPYFWSLFFFGGQLFDSLTRGAMNAEQAGTLLLSSTLNDLTPFQFGSDPDNFMNAGLVAQVIPDAVRAPFELAVNRDYRGETILRERFPGETTPARERGTGREGDMISGLSKKATEFIATITGQDPLSVGGPFDWNPDAVEYLIEEYTGGAGASLLRGAKMVEAAFSGKTDLSPEEMIGLRRFIGRAALGGVRNNYFDGRERIQKVESRYNAMLKAGDKESAEWIKQQDPTALDFASKLRRMEKRRKVLYDARNAAQTAEEREAIEARIDTELGEFVEAFDTAEAQVKD